MSLHTSIYKVWIFFSWPWKRTLKDWIEKVTAWLTPWTKNQGTCTSPMNGRFLSVNRLNFPPCLSREMQPLWIKEGTKSKEKETTGTNGRIRRANEIPRQSRTIYKNVKKALHWNPWYSREYTSTEYAVLEVAEALNVPVVVEDIERFHTN